MTNRTRASNGRSSIYQDDSGTWHAWVTVGTKPDGTLDRRHRRGRTRAEVTEKVRDLERDRDTGTVTKAGTGKTTVSAYLADWLEGSRLRVKVKTLVGYEVDIRVHIVPVIGGKQLTQVKAEDIEKIYVTMTDRGRRQPRSHMCGGLSARPSAMPRNAATCRATRCRWPQRRRSRRPRSNR